MYKLIFSQVRDRLRSNYSQAELHIIILFCLVAIGSAWIGFNITKFPPVVLIGVIVAVAVAFATLVNTNVGLCILIFSMLLSPEIPIAKIPARAITIRIDDFLIFAVFFVWLAKVAWMKNVGLFRRTPLNNAILLYVLSNVISTTLGIISGDANWKSAAFFLLKYAEYLMIYFLFVNNIHEMKQIKVFMFCFFLTFFIIGICTYPQAGIAARPTAPFEGSHGEPNTLGTYLMIGLLCTAGILLYSGTRKLRIIFLGLFCFNLYPLFFTLSRSAYLGFIVGYLSLLIISKRGKIFLIGTLALFLATFPFVLPKTTIGRLVYTFTGTMQALPVKFQVLDLAFQVDKAAAARVQTWNETVLLMKKRPLLGYGVTGLGFIDSQYARALGELGILGLMVVFWLMLKILISSWQVYAKLKDDFSRGLALGFLCTFLGLFFVAFATNIFVIVRIAEPLWFLAACVMVLPYVQTDEGLELDAATEAIDST